MFNSEHWLRVYKARMKQNIASFEYPIIASFEPRNGPIIILKGQKVWIQKVYLDWYGKWILNVLYHNDIDSHGTYILKEFLHPTHEIEEVVKRATKFYQDFLTEVL